MRAFPVSMRHGVAAAALAVLVTGCASVGALPEVDLGDPRWTVWQGQVRWKPNAERPALAGDLIVARGPGGDVLVSFSKTPLPIFTAQISTGSWRIDFVERGRAYSGRGRPPKRFVWFFLPQILAGAAAPGRWEVDKVAGDEWQLVHPGRGEEILVVLDLEAGR